MNELIKQRTNKSVFKTYLIYFIVMLIFCTYSMLISKVAIFSGLKSFQADIINTIIIQICIVFLIPAILYCTIIKTTPKQLFRTCNYSTPNIKMIFIAILLGIICFIINIMVNSVFMGMIRYFGYAPTGIFSSTDGSIIFNFVLDVILVAMLPALCEEFLHRGIVLQGTKHTGYKKAIFISSILFALMHYNIEQFAYAFIIGLIMGIVSVVAKNIWPAIIIHSTNNFIATYFSYAESMDWAGSGFLNWLGSLRYNADMIVVCVGVALVVIAVVVSLVFLLYWLYRSAKVEKSELVYDKKKNMLIRQRVINSTNKIDWKNVNSENPIDLILPKQNNIYVKTRKDNYFLYLSITLGAILTICSLVWGFF